MASWSASLPAPTIAGAPRASKGRALVIVQRDPFNPAQRERRTVKRRRSISALAPRTRNPVVAYHNGRVILRNEWRRRVVDGDVVAFVVLPTGGGGGGGKNPMQVVAMIALSMVAPGMGEALYAGMGGTFVSSYAPLAISALNGAVSMAGNPLISSPGSAS